MLQMYYESKDWTRGNFLQFGILHLLIYMTQAGQSFKHFHVSLMEEKHLKSC